MVILMYKWLVIVATFFNHALIPFHSNAGSTEFVAEEFHPFYVSVTEINHNEKEKTLEIACKIFTDDLESTLNKNYNTRIDFFSDKTNDIATKCLNDYIGRHLLIQVDGKPVKAQIIGFERESEALWSYYEVKNVASVKKMQVRNSILYDAFKDQINLMHVTVNGSRRSSKLNYPDIIAEFGF